MAVRLWPLVANRISVGGQPVIAVYGPTRGGWITNPATPEAQNVAVAEPIYVDLVNTATVGTSQTTIAVQPGYTFVLPSDPDTVWRASVNAASAGHTFGGFVYHEPPNYQPLNVAFPPSGPVTLTNTIPAYLYKEYDDDEALQVMFMAYNSLTQYFVAWFATIGLPVYTNPLITGALLDWIIGGLYGLERPTLPSGMTQQIGPLNTYRLNTMRLNDRRRRGPTGFYLTNDDVYRRILTWHYYKDDGKVFNIRWLKRRIIRFLTGTNGTEGDTASTYPISITFGADAEININIQTIRRYATGGSLLNASRLNQFRLNELKTAYYVLPVGGPMLPIFKAAMEAGVLEMPFQWNVIVNIN